jgi:hypothetical protein
VRWPSFAQADKFFFSAAPVAIGAKAIARIPVDELQYAAASGRVLQCLQKSLSRSWKFCVALSQILKNGNCHMSQNIEDSKTVLSHHL